VLQIPPSVIAQPAVSMVIWASRSTPSLDQISRENSSANGRPPARSSTQPRIQVWRYAVTLARSRTWRPTPSLQTVMSVAVTAHR
jgi:hypothetical protein